MMLEKLKVKNLIRLLEDEDLEAFVFIEDSGFGLEVCWGGVRISRGFCGEDNTFSLTRCKETAVEIR